MKRLFFIYLFMQIVNNLGNYVGPSLIAVSGGGGGGEDVTPALPIM